MKPLANKEIEQELEILKGWKHKNDAIWKQFEFKNFKEALVFIVKVGFEAESQSHHPNISNIYSKVTISLQTHDVGNKVTIKDINLAKAIETTL